jgi:hypothetical protein
MCLYKIPRVIKFRHLDHEVSLEPYMSPLRLWKFTDSQILSVARQLNSKALY